MIKYLQTSQICMSILY